VRARRSIVFYAWLGLVGQTVFLTGAVVFVVAGASYQRSAIRADSRAQRLQLETVTIQASFLNALRSVRGYQLTRQDRFLQSYYTERASFATELSDARSIAWRGVVSLLDQEGSAALEAFRLNDQGLSFHRGDPRSLPISGRVALASNRFTDTSGRLQAQLAHVTGGLAAASQRSLGVGLAGTSIVLVLGLMIPIMAAGYILRWTIVPLLAVTATVRKLAAHDYAARAVPGGPAELRDLSLSVDALADESDRLRAEQERNTRLSAVVRETAMRVREHLDAGDVTREAVTSMVQNLGCDHVWVLISGGEPTLRLGNTDDWGQGETVIENLPPESLDWMDSLYQQRSSLCLQNLRADEPSGLPVWIRDLLLAAGGVSLLFMPFGTGRKLLGGLALLRTQPGRRWTPGEISAVEAIATDVARGLDHAILYERQKDLVEKLRDVDHAKSDFLAAVSHDLRVPLTNIAGYAEMLGDSTSRPLDARRQQMVGAIERNATRLRNLIDDVLTMSKIETGNFETAMRPTDLAAVVSASVEEIRPAATANGLDLQLASPAAGLVVQGDSEQLDRALTNLLSNAVKYTPGGGIIEVTASRDGARAMVTIRDTGIGIPDGDQQSLFTRFFRASNAIRGSVPGTGLGLAIVRTIVDSHHGDVELSSREGVGTTVTIALPLAEGGPSQDGHPPAPVTAAARPAVTVC
jgi:two-component system, OmpR family, phosphate regulon sensor histidine kinase PhoR